MSDPFESPKVSEPERPTVLVEEPSRLLEVAKNQKYVILILLATMLIVPVSWFSIQMELDVQALASVITALTWILAATRAVFVYRLAVCVDITVGSAAVLALFSVVGMIGLIILLVVNQRATKQLKAAGAHVGLFGVPQHELDQWWRAAQESKQAPY